MVKVPKPKHQIKIYTTPNCPYCYTLKEFLKEREIAFEEIDVSQDEQKREEMVQKAGRMEVPVLDIDGKIVIGFDREKIINLLNIKD